MWTHFFTLRALAKELDPVLRGTTILEIFTQRKNELLISVSPPKEQGDQTLVISVDPKMNFLFGRGRIMRAKKNSVDVFPGAAGTRVTKVSTHSRERMLYLDLSNDLQLCGQLFGTAASNVFLLDEQGFIKNAFKNAKHFVGKRLNIARGNNDEEFFPDITLFTSNILKESSASVFAALKVIIPVLGSTFAREVLHRAAVDEKLQAQRLEEEDIQKIYSAIDRLREELRSPKPTVYFRDNQPRVFSVIPLHHLAGMRSEHFPSVNDAIRTRAAQSSRNQEFETRKNNLIHRLKGELDRTMRSLGAVREESIHARQADEHERIANILMANLQHLTKGTKVVDLEDIFSTNKRQLRIALDPKLTPVRNAEQYFEKAKRARRAREEMRRRLQMLEEKQVLIEKLLLHVDYCQNKEQLDEFQQEHKATLQEWKIVSTDEGREQLPFRILKVSGDFEVWVGKSSANNDLLTMKYAKANDLWFHVRGASGSHVVLKVGTGKTQPSRQAIREAASIAAFYSKMKNASAVPIAYCPRKYIRKPKGAEPGSVVMEREKLVFVEPRLP